MSVKTTLTAFPRIGEKRELKKALEHYWSGKISQADLEKIASELRQRHWLYQKEMKIDLISCNDFSFYDSMLDTICLLGAIPKRFRSIEDPLERYFAMARGFGNISALEMTKWFNTNYHYLVPELESDLSFTLNPSKIISEYTEARTLDIRPKINIIGPMTFLLLSKTTNGKSHLDFFEPVLNLYEDLLHQLANLDESVFIQFEEPAFVKDPHTSDLAKLKTAYTRLSNIHPNLKIILTTYFEHSKEATRQLADLPLWGFGLDFVHGKQNLDSLPLIADKKLIAGIVNGRNIWKNNFNQSLELLSRISKTIPRENIIISSSCSLLHVPYTTRYEDANLIKSHLSFALEKIEEIVLLSKLFHNQNLSDREKRQVNKQQKLFESNSISQNPVSNKPAKRKLSYEKRIKIQQEHLKLPILPLTTIGSFPQTPELRTLRQNYKKGVLSEDLYKQGLRKYIFECIRFQEEIDLDVLVHGEPERNDMVEYFGEQLEGFHFTTNGWIQSYGSRCVKPPILYSTVRRPAPITVEWITYAQSLTKRPVKGMLTGPVTILNWSFVREDIPRSEIARQIAIAIREEIQDLQEHGIRIIQVDEAAFKEGYPLRKDQINEYEDWAVRSFNLAVSLARPETQIHTHMCYSEFNDILPAISQMDSDVLSVEFARSGGTLAEALQTQNYQKQIGPGVYDIHSPRIPSPEEIKNRILTLSKIISHTRLWINPDCGLKTRKWEEVKPALQNMVKTTKEIRKKFQKTKVLS